MSPLDFFLIRHLASTGAIGYSSHDFSDQALPLFLFPAPATMLGPCHLTQAVVPLGSLLFETLLSPLGLRGVLLSPLIEALALPNRLHARM